MVGAEGGADQGNLVFATGDTGTQNKIIFAAGGLASDNEQMSITPDLNVHIEIPTPSTSPTTGALTVVGGVGISGDVNINGSITFGGESSSLETTTLAVADPLIFVGSNNRTDAVDLGLIAEYATSTTTITKDISNKALTSNVATLTTSTTHGFAVGDIVVVGSVDATFNGTYVVKAVPTTTTFTYDKTNANVTSAAVSPAGSAEVTTKRRFAGAIRDASDGVFKIFKDATTKPSTTVNLAEAGASLGSLLVGAAEIGSVSNTEIQYLDGVTSAIQTQLNAKANLAGPTFTGTVTLPSDTSIGDVSATELGHVNGVTSAIQTQLDSKQPISLATTNANSSYSLILADAGKLVEASNASAMTVTVPLNATHAFPAGSQVNILQTGVGQVTIVATAGVTINANPGLKLRAQWSFATLIKRAENTWVLVGDLTS
jgi:hypothetical protein